LILVNYGIEVKKFNIPTKLGQFIQLIKMKYIHEIISIHWTFNIMYLFARAIHKFEIQAKYLLTLEALKII